MFLHWLAILAIFGNRFYADGALDPTSIECNEDLVKITVHASTLVQMKASKEEVGVGLHPDCHAGKGNYTYKNQCKVKGPSMEISFKPTDCYPIVKREGDYVLFTYTLMKAPVIDTSSVITRFQCNQKQLTCKMKKYKSFNKGGSRLVNASGPSFSVAKKTVSFPMELNLKTKDYAGDAVSYKVAAKEFVYMEAKVITANVSIKALSCYATSKPTLEASGKQVYPIIKAGCPANNSYDNADSSIVVKANGGGRVVQFQFRAFEWVWKTGYTKTSIYVHCEIEGCYNDMPSCNLTKTACSAKKRYRRDTIDAAESTTNAVRDLVKSEPIQVVFAADKPPKPVTEKSDESICAELMATRPMMSSTCEYICENQRKNGESRCQCLKACTDLVRLNEQWQQERANENMMFGRVVMFVVIILIIFLIRLVHLKK